MRRLSTLALIASAAALVFVGCDGGGDGAAGIGGSADMSGDTFAVVGAEDAFAAIQDATVSQPMAMNPVIATDGSFRRHHRHPAHAGSHLGLILRQLDLTEEQVEAVRAILAEHRATVQPILEQLRLANQELIRQANRERERILQALEDGAITGEQARRLLLELSVETRRAIRANPDNAPYFAALCQAKRALFDEIRSVLDETQQAIWDEWVAGLPGPCLGD